MANDRLRLDEALVAAGLAPSRSRARDMIRRGTVTVGGMPETRTARKVDPDEKLSVGDPGARYVSRAALKLIFGLDHLALDPAGLTVLDLGASTGGFTQVLLERGAAHVIAVDVGYGQLAAALAADRRVTLYEGLNARDLTAAHLSGRKIGAIVADLSFISLKLALPPALALAEPRAWAVFLVKPQFEVGRTHIGKGGVVRDQSLARQAAEDVAAWLEAERFEAKDELTSGAGQGGGCASCAPGRRDAAFPSDGVPWRVVGLEPSPIEGGDGNREYLLGARRG